MCVTELRRMRAHSAPCQHNPATQLRYVRPASHSGIAAAAILRPAFFPFAAIERLHRHRFDGVAVDAAHVDADPIRMRTRNVEGFHAADRAEEVLGDVGIERVGRQRIAAADQLEAVRRHDEVQIPELAADGAIAVRDLEVGRRDDLETNAAAMTTTGVGRHSRDRASACVLAPPGRRPVKSSAPGCRPRRRRRYICHSRQIWGRRQCDSAAPARRLFAPQDRPPWSDRPS